MNEKNALEFAVANSAAITEQLNDKLASGRDIVAVPDGYRIEDLERLHGKRRQPRGVYHTRHFADFITYAAAHSSEGAVMFIDPESMRAEVIFDHDRGAGHARDRAVYQARLTESAQALVDLCDRGNIDQQDLIQYLEDWAEDVLPYSTEGSVLDTSAAVQIVRNLTLERAKTIKQVRGDFEYEQSAAEKAALRKEGEMLGGIELRDVVYSGLTNKVTMRAKLSLVLFDGGFDLSLRLVGFDALRRDKVEEMENAAADSFEEREMQVYRGTYDAK